MHRPPIPPPDAATDRPPVPPARKWRRRAVLASGAAALFLWVRYLPKLPEIFASGPEYHAIPGLAPFRSLDAQGSVTAGGGGALIGIEPTGEAPSWHAWVPRVTADPCRYLFGAEGAAGGAAVPVAYFTDYQCPNCRLLEARLADYAKDHPGRIVLIRHELPLLGPSSVIAARAVLAARLQAGSAAFERRLMQGRVVASRPAMMAIADSVGLDPARLARDMQGQAVQDVLDRDRALAAVFGFFATPGCVIGRTAFLGAVDARLLGRLIDAEAALGPVRCKT
ncbi:DsbA family protein [Allgaiera indica]|nr:DsbA family protein [Allgaiera indica]